MHEVIDRWIDLNFSPDENVYYFQDFKNDKVSKPYKSKIDALKAYRDHKIQWEAS